LNQTGEVLLKFKDEWPHFSRPLKVITAANMGEVQVNYTMHLQTEFVGRNYIPIYDTWNFFLHLAQTQTNFPFPQNHAAGSL